MAEVLRGCGDEGGMAAHMTARDVGCIKSLLWGHHGHCGHQSDIGHRVGGSPVEEGG